MSHREKSLTPWITSDADLRKDDECMRRTGMPCIRVPPSLYRAGEAAGLDMSNYVPQRPMPTSTLHEHKTPPYSDYDKLNLHGVYVVEHKMPTSAQRRDSIRDKIAKGEPLGASHVPNLKPGVVTNGSVTGYAKYGPSDKPRWMGCPPAKPKDETDDG